jgi:hypothetical protein
VPRHLRGLTLTLSPPDPVFAGSNAPLRIVLSNERKATRYGIGLAVLDASHEDRWAWTDVPGQGTSRCGRLPALRRGLHRVPPLTAETRFPLGTFRVWTVWRPAAQVLVYPQPEALPPPLPEGEPRAGTAGPTRVQSIGEFEGVRGYRRGDPLKLVVWKKAAKTDELVSRDTQQAQRTELWLEFAKAGAVDAEARLSRLAAWVVQADKLGPGLRPAAAGQGDRARRRRGARAAAWRRWRCARAHQGPAARRARHAVPGGGHRLAGAAPGRPPALVVHRAGRGAAGLARGTLAVRRRAAARQLVGAGAAGRDPGRDLGITHRTLLGRDAGVTLIVVLLALKTLELRARRDAFVVFFLGFFTMLTNFFFSQSLLTAAAMLVGLLGLLTALVNAHMPVGRPPLLQAARTAGWMALLGAPMMAVLFMLFPRWRRCGASRTTA